MHLNTIDRVLGLFLDEVFVFGKKKQFEMCSNITVFFRCVCVCDVAWVFVKSPLCFSGVVFVVAVFACLRMCFLAFLGYILFLSIVKMAIWDIILTKFCAQLKTYSIVFYMSYVLLSWPLHGRT